MAYAMDAGCTSYKINRTIPRAAKASPWCPRIKTPEMLLLHDKYTRVVQLKESHTPFVKHTHAAHAVPRTGMGQAIFPRQYL